MNWSDKLEQVEKGYRMKVWWCLLNCWVIDGTLCYGEIYSKYYKTNWLD
jgi:hypothetical protein